MALGMTYRQKKNMQGVWILAGFLAFIAAMVCVFVFVPAGSSAQVNTPPTPQVNATRYEQINLGDDGTIDHFCVGREGFSIGPQTGDFAVTPGDPLCR